MNEHQRDLRASLQEIEEAETREFSKYEANCYTSEQKSTESASIRTLVAPILLSRNRKSQFDKLKCR